MKNNFKWQILFDSLTLHVKSNNRSLFKLNFFLALVPSVKESLLLQCPLVCDRFSSNGDCPIQSKKILKTNYLYMTRVLGRYPQVLVFHVCLKFTGNRQNKKVRWCAASCENMSGRVKQKLTNYPTASNLIQVNWIFIY